MIEVTVREGRLEVWLTVNELRAPVLFLTPAAALDLAARLKSAAEGLLSEAEPASVPTCRGVLRNGFHCLCWRATRNHPSGLCPMHRKAVEQGEAELVG